MIQRLLTNINNKEAIFLNYILIINIISFITMGLDKLKAKKEEYRISENFLMLLSLIGGAKGTILGMILFHHKVKKRKFCIGIAIVYLSTCIIGSFILNYLR